MRRLFLRLYLGILLALALSGLASVALIVGGFRGNVVAKTDKVMAFPATTFVLALDASSDRAATARTLAEAAGYGVVVRPRAAVTLTKGEAAALESVGRVSRMEGRELWTYAVLADGDLAALGPLSIVEPDRNGTLLAGLPALLLGMGLGAWLLIRPLARQLGALSGAADLLGHGRLDARSAVLNEDASGELAATFNRMAERIEALVAAREDLLRGVSHDLRTPLARLRFGLELLAGDPDADARAARIEAIEDDLRLLDERVDELVRFARLRSAGALSERACTDVGEVVEAVVRAAGASSGGVNVTIDTAPRVEVAVPAEWLTRAVENLVANAVRYATRLVRVGWTVEREVVRVTVCDDGPGVPEAERASVFEPFRQLGGEDEPRRGGFGLGLAIVAGIAERTGGRVWVEDAGPDGGARFVLELPRARADHGGSA